MLVWAVSVSSLAAYFYLQNNTYSQQIAENQHSLNKITSTYNELMIKYNRLLSEYSTLYGNYSFPQGVNFTLLMIPLGRLIDNLKGNYSSLLMEQNDLNETYQALKEEYQTVYEQNNVTREDFGELLNKYYELFNLLTLRELSTTVSETVTLTVNICIDYGNGTIEWHNDIKVPAGSSLFQVTQKIAVINYTYYPSMKPGHILVDSINNWNETGGYWIWFYWNEEKQDWIFGPVGCDAWMLEDGGLYKWKFEHWS